jgi:hypothetical protein
LKVIRFDFSLDPRHAARKDWHDGVGGVHRHGDIVHLPDEAADAAIAAKAAVAAAGSDAESYQLVKKREEARQEAARIASQQYMAQQRMAVYDALPADVRAAVHENGDEVVEAYIAEQQQAAAAEAEQEAIAEIVPERRKRGRPRKLQS